MERLFRKINHWLHQHKSKGYGIYATEPAGVAGVDPEAPQLGCRESYIEKKRPLPVFPAGAKGAVKPWDEWVIVIAPCDSREKGGHPSIGTEKMQRMYLPPIWCKLSNPAVE